MKATETLKEEHRVIERVLDAVERAIIKFKEGNQVDPQFFLDLTDFIKGFADGCHHRKEEGVLFKIMQDHGVAVTGGPIGVMLEEHERGRKFTQGILTAVKRWKAGDEQAMTELLEQASGYVTLLRMHIQKEDTILFPLADRAIPLEKHGLVDKGFEHVEHTETGDGVHEKYLALAHELIAQVL